MNKFVLFAILYIFSVFVSSVSQILLKKSANKQYKNWIEEYTNPKVIIAYTMFFGATLITVCALKYIPVSMGAVFESTGYVFVAILGRLFLNEHIVKRKILGLFIIMCGVIIFSTM